MQVLVIQNVSQEGPGFLGPALEKVGLKLDIRVMVDQPGARLPQSLGGYGAMVSLGGRWASMRKIPTRTCAR